jgi:HEAT repeat protein
VTVHLLSLLSRISQFSLGCSFFLVLSFTGCYLDTPPASPDAVSAWLVNLLGDRSPEIRRTAVEALGKIGSSSQIHRVIQTLSDPDPHVREAGVIALGRLGVQPDGIQALVQALSDTAKPVRTAAARSLGELNEAPAASNPLVQLLKDPDKQKRKAAIQALVQFEAKNAFPQLSLAVRDPDAEVRQGAVAALGEWWGEQAIPLLWERLIRDADSGVRVEAAYRLGKIGHQDLVKGLDHVAATDHDITVRRWAKWASDQLRRPLGSG